MSTRRDGRSVSRHVSGGWTPGDSEHGLEATATTGGAQRALPASCRCWLVARSSGGSDAQCNSKYETPAVQLRMHVHALAKAAAVRL